MSAAGGDPGQAQQAGSRRLWWLAFLPLAIFAALAAVFFVQLFAGDPSRLPSALIGKKVPEFQLAALPGLNRNGAPVPGFSSDDLASGKVSLVNVWASWCAPCRLEHPILMQAAQSGEVRLYGMNYKDKPENARRFLGQLGNPYAAVGTDPSGRVGIDWGVYGVPETFIVDGQGRIVYKHVGPIDAAAMQAKIMPAIAGASAAAR